MSRSLSNLDIQEYYKNEPRFGGCFARDNLPKKIANKFYVVNMDRATGAGTHWVVIFNVPVPDENPDYTLYCDAYGIYPPPEILKFLRTSKRKIVYTTDQYQGFTSSQCGYYCILVIDKLLKSVPYRKLFDGILKEGEIHHNEAVVRKLSLRK